MSTATTAVVIDEVNNRRIKAFRDAMTEGRDAVARAAQIYVEALDEDPAAHSAFVQGCPGIPASAWSGFEAVGRGWLDKRLLWSEGTQYTAIRRLSRSTQERVLDNGVPILSKDGTELLVRAENMTRQLSSQAFAGDHVRTLGEQRAWQESLPTVKPPRPEGPAYEVKRGKCYILRPTTLTLGDMARAMQEMTR